MESDKFCLRQSYGGRRKLGTILTLIIFFSFFGWVGSSQADISSVSGDVIHGQSITISGSDFGIKNPAKPLMWDDCESETVDTAPSEITVNSASQVAYSDYQLGTYRNGVNIPEAYQMKYRTFPYTPVSVAITAPHSYSTQCLSGGHYETGSSDNAGRSISLTIPTAGGIGVFADRWYIRFLYHVNPEWPSCQSDTNHKVTIMQSDISEYGGPTYVNDYYYMSFGVPDYSPCGHEDADHVYSHNNACTDSTYDSFPDNTPPWYFGQAPDHTGGASATLAGAWTQWIENTQVVSNDQGYLYYYINNKLTWGGENNPDFFTGSGSYDLGYPGIGSVSIGGYWSYTNVPQTQNNNAFRLFDDIYVDDTLSRVMLANNSTYESATIVEPQPPTAWASGEITVTVNQGRLPDGTAYLFVFDADGNSSVGSVTVGGTFDTTAPSHPTGLGVE